MKTGCRGGKLRTLFSITLCLFLLTVVSLIGGRNITKDKIKAMQYNLTKVDSVLKPLMLQEQIKEQVYNRFSKVEFMPVSEVKVILQDIYDRNGLNKRAKATDIIEYMDCKIISKKINGTVMKVVKFR